jgi:hypothetical protein
MVRADDMVDELGQRERSPRSRQPSLFGCDVVEDGRRIDPLALATRDQRSRRIARIDPVPVKHRQCERAARAQLADNQL